MYTFLKYVGTGLITIAIIALVEKFVPNLEITEELTIFVFASMYMNILNLINHANLEDKVRINQFLNTRLNVELHGEERCNKAVEKMYEEYLKDNMVNK